jgi:putative ABC transport system permease protein
MSATVCAGCGGSLDSRRSFAVTLALGVGVNAAMFGLVDLLMFRTPVVAAGRTVGAAAAVAASRYVESLLFNVQAADPRAPASAAAIIVAAALAGCVIPAVRAACVDPAQALRTD